MSRARRELERNYSAPGAELDEGCVCDGRCRVRCPSTHPPKMIWCSLFPRGVEGSPRVVARPTRPDTGRELRGLKSHPSLLWSSVTQVTQTKISVVLCVFLLSQILLGPSLADKGGPPPAPTPHGSRREGVGPGRACGTGLVGPSGPVVATGVFRPVSLHPHPTRDLQKPYRHTPVDPSRTGAGTRAVTGCPPLR